MLARAKRLKASNSSASTLLATMNENPRTLESGVYDTVQISGYRTRIDTSKPTLVEEPSPSLVRASLT
jgi:hypothetical protein